MSNLSRRLRRLERAKGSELLLQGVLEIHQVSAGCGPGPVDGREPCGEHEGCLVRRTARPQSGKAIIIRHTLELGV